MSLTSLIAPGKRLPGGAGKHSGRLLALAAAGLITLASGAVQPAACKITVVSYHLRDRAVVLDSLVMRKRMIFAFKCSGKLSELRGAAVSGELSCQSRLMARDTAYLFDQAAGNLGFCLPYEIPDSDYRLDIRVISKKGTLLDSYSGSFERKMLRPYFQRGINFWDFTQPYAHLECSGYGELTYRFRSDRQLRPGSLQISARMTSDNRSPALVEVSLNGVGLGRFELPAPEQGQVPEVVSWRVDEAQALQGVSVRPGENSLS
ncbi:MAG: hypothetical protein JXQ83_09700, partial [Candidatus Glassbacteria bacterium]|nr:hypothetical protein [Candidatus Glassbacteria bacterium]